MRVRRFRGLGATIIGGALLSGSAFSTQQVVHDGVNWWNAVSSQVAY